MTILHMVGVRPRGRSDPYWQNVVLLMHFTGTPGAAGPWTDSSKYNHAFITGNGAVIHNDSAKPGFGTVLKIPNTGDDFIKNNILNEPEFQMGTGDFTIELFINRNKSGSNQCFFEMRDNGDNNNNCFTCGYGSDDCFYWRSVSTVYKFSSPSTVNVWQHVAFTRQSNILRGFQDGVKLLEITDATDFTRVYSSGRPILGVSHSQAGNFKGWMDEVRVTKGVARYTANFTPPTEPFPNS